jgi:C4-type Zn-finger protein
VVAGLVLNEQQITCPFCHVDLMVSSPMSTIFVAQRRCPNCQKEFVIVNDVPMTPFEHGKEKKVA